MRGTELMGFQTYMTGEVFECLKSHTILGKLMAHGAPFDDEAFDRGVERSLMQGGLLHQIFSVRSGVLFGDLSESTAASYLSGMLIGAELREALQQDPLRTHVILLGDESLCDKYKRAFVRFKVEAQIMPDTSLVGLHHLSSMIAEELPSDCGAHVVARPLRPAQPLDAVLQRFRSAMAEMPLVAILRGVEPAQAVSVGETLVEMGFRIIEVPLNSPKPYQSIRLLHAAVGTKALIGAGTVLTTEEVALVAQAGGRLIVSPNTNCDIIKSTVAAGLVSLPGFATPSEAFAAIHAGAHGLKLFPAEGIEPKVLRAMKAVLPHDVPVVVVGGVGNFETMAAFWAAGAAGFGIGSGLFKAEMSSSDIRTRAADLVAAAKRLGR
jgi:2-dehydro-3-deoxyphosphogalactonate aldolase